MASIFPFILARKKHLEEDSRKYEDLANIYYKSILYINKVKNDELEENDIPEDERNNDLINSIISLDKKLKAVAIKDKQRNWATNGLAHFVDLLRDEQKDFKELIDLIIANIIKYIGANQGAIFLKNNEVEGDVYLEMAGCYAYNKKKYIDKRIEIGQGLVGQCYREEEKIVLTDIPQHYVKITSGLGEATPSFLLLVPIKHNSEIVGVVEIATFSVLLAHEIEFVEKLSEIIASTIINRKTTSKMAYLLDIAQERAEAMLAQEEELRQNMEELEAAQEEMIRGRSEVERLLTSSIEKEVQISALALKSTEEKERLQAEIGVLKFQSTRKDKKIKELEDRLNNNFLQNPMKFNN